MRSRETLLALLIVPGLAYDMGPTFAADYAGEDYNVTSWHTPDSGSANNYEASAKACEAYCFADPKCCAWTYCPPGTGDEDTNATFLTKNGATLGERCCLKSHVPAERKGVKHWTGLAPRAVTDKDNKTLSAQCKGPQPPGNGCKEVGGKCVAPYPGADFLHPKIHQSPDCLHLGGWHDVAGALTFQGVHHVFQGCPASKGWSHSASTDLVHWQDRGRGVHMLHETYEGMDSTSCGPCSGFVTVDDEGTPCAGFRQCGSDKGATGLNPQAHPWDVPMELRCAENHNLTDWSAPIWIYPAYYYRGLPYDPVRPWKDTDGKWYSAWSTDGCNGTTQWGPTPAANLKKTPCRPGGQLELLVADELHGPKAQWRQLPPLFTTNVTCSGRTCTQGRITREFVTSGYFGGLSGDPDGGKTRVVTQNNAGPTFWVGTQSAGGQFEAMWDRVGAVGHYDYGSLTMARTLGSDPNQVAKNGRRVLVGWIGGTPASQSLARDLSLSADYELLQQFVPELQMLRKPDTFAHTVVSAESNDAIVPHATGALQLEVVATFSWSGEAPSAPFGVSVLGGTAKISIDCTTKNADAPCMVVSPATGPVLPIGTKSVSVHAIVDHEIVETIANNRTAMVTYHKNIPSATSTAVALFGTGAGITAELKTWVLNAANNAGPQP